MAELRKWRVAVAGASGYSGQELCRLVLKHRHLELVATSGREDRPEDLARKAEIVFLCTPNEVSHEWAPVLLQNGCHVVDVAGAFRLKHHSYPEWYGFEHRAPELLERAEYGLYPWRKLRPVKNDEAPRLVANPGCFPTATLMALLPLLQSQAIDPTRLVIDAKSGTTGAGRKAEVRLLFSEVYGEFSPYKVGRHQHFPEIVEACQEFAATKIHPLFVTQLLPLPRGISTAIYCEWKAGEAMEAVQASFEKAYGQEADVRVGTDDSLASLKAVVGTNRVHIQLVKAYGRLAVFSVIDNLLRGAAGQALMNANQLLGLSPQEGLA